MQNKMREVLEEERILAEKHLQQSLLEVKRNRSIQSVIESSRVEDERGQHPYP